MLCPSPRFFACPTLTSRKICRLDWLHAADQGVAADYTGQLYKFLLPRLGGRNPSLGLDVLWKGIQSGYERHPTKSKLDTLTAAMLSPSARVPRLKCCAAEYRAMVPIALDFARAHLNRGDRNESTILLAMTELHPSILGGSPHCMWHWKRQEWNLSALSRNFTFFRNWPRWTAANPPCLGPTETKISVVRWQGWCVGGEVPAQSRQLVRRCCRGSSGGIKFQS